MVVVWHCGCQDPLASPRLVSASAFTRAIHREVFEAWPYLTQPQTPAIVPPPHHITPSRPQPQCPGRSAISWLTGSPNRSGILAAAGSIQLGASMCVSREVPSCVAQRLPHWATGRGTTSFTPPFMGLNAPNQNIHNH